MMIRSVSIAALCLTAAIAFAQEGPPPDAGKRMDRMALLLDLDAGQRVAVEKILTEQRETMRATHKAARESGERPAREAMKTQMDAERAATIEKLRPVLSDVQLTKFLALTDHPPGPPGMRGGKRPDKQKSTTTK